MVRDLTLTMRNKQTGELETWSVNVKEWFDDEIFECIYLE